MEYTLQFYWFVQIVDTDNIHLRMGSITNELENERLSSN